MGLFNKAKDDTDKMAKNHQNQSSQATDQDQQGADHMQDDEYDDFDTQSDMETAQGRIGRQRGGQQPMSQDQDQMRGQGSMHDQYQDEDQDEYQDPDQMFGQPEARDQDDEESW